MIIKVQADDGQDLIIMVGEGRGTVGIATTNVGKSQPDLEDFTIEEVQEIVGALGVAIKIAMEERDYLEELK
jgi:hypothetical protein